MLESEQESTNDEVEIVNLDEEEHTFSTWQKKTFAAFSRHKRMWIGIALVSICIVLLIAALRIPFVQNRVWSQISGIPLDAISIQVKGQEVSAQHTIDHAPLWHVTLDNVLSGPPQIANHILYLRTNSHTFYAIRETSGSVLWRYRYQDFSIYQPVLAHGMIYVGSHTGRIRALRTTDGSVLWQVSAQGMVTSPLLVSDDKIFFSRNQNSIVALRTTDGSVLWQTQLKTGNTSNELHATSEILQASNVIIYADTTSTVTSGEKHIVALRMDGFILWSLTVNTNVLRSVLASEKNLYILSAEGRISAYGSSNGIRLWQHVLGNDYTLSIALIDSVLYVNALNGESIGLRAQDGSQVTYYHSNIALASPVVFDHRIYTNTNAIDGTGVSVPFQDSGIAAVSSANGSLLWKYFTLIPLSSPSVVGERVYVTDLQGQVYTLDARSGSLIWHS